MWPFSNFHYGFRTSRSTADLLTFILLRLCRIATAGVWGYSSCSTRYIQGLNMVWHTSLLHKRKYYSLIALRGPFLVLNFSCYTLITFLIMLCVILLSMLMVLLSTLNVMRPLIFGNSENWLPNLNLIYETLWTGAVSGLLISILEKLSLSCLTGLMTVVLLM